MATSIAKVFRRDKMKEGKAPVYIRITKNRKTTYIATTLRLEERHWDDKQKKVKSSYPNSAQANTYLNGLVFEIEAEALQEQTKNRNSSAQAIKERFTSDKTISFSEVAKDMQEKYKRNDKISTHDTFMATINKVKEFARKDKLTFQEIDLSFLNRFEAYLRDDLKNKSNTVNKDMKIVRRVFNTAYRQGLIEHSQSPFNKFTMKAEKVFREHLVEAELKKLEELSTFKGCKLELHRDMFVFACYAGGLRVSDVLLLRWNNFDGTHIHVTDRKTSSQHSIKLPKASLAIVSKYRPEDSNSTGFIFPMLPERMDMNDAIEVDACISRATAYANKSLKELGKLAGIKKHLHFHVSRHTFACLALVKGMGLEHVSKLMAHSNIKQTQHYAKLVSRELDAAMDKFNF